MPLPSRRNPCIWSVSEVGNRSPYFVGLSVPQAVPVVLLSEPRLKFELDAMGPFTIDGLQSPARKIYVLRV